jgi:hypothetical protein
MKLKIISLLSITLYENVMFNKIWSQMFNLKIISFSNEVFMTEACVSFKIGPQAWEDFEGKDFHNMPATLPGVL